MLNKPPKVPMKGNLPVHNSMDVLAAAALSYGNEEGPKLVRLFLFIWVAMCNLKLSLMISFLWFVSAGSSTGQRL